MWLFSRAKKKKIDRGLWNIRRNMWLFSRAKKKTARGLWNIRLQRRSGDGDAEGR
jgi:hypothetical protein